MSIYVALLKKYGEEIVPLERICGQELDLKFRVARLKPVREKLPFPVFRLRDSRRAPWMVNLRDVAVWLEKRAQDARATWGEGRGEAQG